MRLIDADVAERWMVQNEAVMDIAILKAIPTVDAVPVVRCKDCIRRYDTDECPMCFLIEGKYYEYTNENGYCDRGERKEGVDNGC